jgi:hypothetical protein
MMAPNKRAIRQWGADIELAIRLAEFVSHHEPLDQEWGKVDCCLALADWGMWLGEEDTATDLRGTYSTEEGCKSVVMLAGGLVPLVQRCADRAGWVRIERPVTGAIGVIGATQRVGRQFGAIFDGTRWLVRMEKGFVAFNAKPIAIWWRECLPQ